MGAEMGPSQMTLSRIFRQKRRELSITQSELADRVGCKQSAISMFEAGRSSALADRTLERIGKILDVDISEFPPNTTASDLAKGVLKYCPIDECPSNIPYTVGGQLYFVPGMVQSREAEHTRCVLCGELMQAQCPNSDCNAAAVAGACCPQCGTAYVTATVTLSGTDTAQWADRRRRQIREIAEMCRSRPI